MRMRRIILGRFQTPHVTHTKDKVRCIYIYLPLGTHTQWQLNVQGMIKMIASIKVYVYIASRRERISIARNQIVQPLNITSSTRGPNLNDCEEAALESIGNMRVFWTFTSTFFAR